MKPFSRNYIVIVAGSENCCLNLTFSYGGRRDQTIGFTPYDWVFHSHLIFVICYKSMHTWFNGLPLGLVFFSNTFRVCLMIEYVLFEWWRRKFWVPYFISFWVLFIDDALKCLIMVWSGEGSLASELWLQKGRKWEFDCGIAWERLDLKLSFLPIFVCINRII